MSASFLFKLLVGSAALAVIGCSANAVEPEDVTEEVTFANLGKADSAGAELIVPRDGERSLLLYCEHKEGCDIAFLLTKDYRWDVETTFQRADGFSIDGDQMRAAYRPGATPIPRYFEQLQPLVGNHYFDILTVANQPSGWSKLTVRAGPYIGERVTLWANWEPSGSFFCEDTCAAPYECVDRVCAVRANTND